MDRLRRRIVAEFEKGAGRHDDPTVYGGTPGDPGLIGPGSVSWAVNADLAAVSQAGLPAIVLEILHPSVVAGVQDLSNYRQEPLARARATLGYVLTTTFGNTEAATRLIEHVKGVHSYVKGTRPDGVPYRALDPELIAWVHTCIPWMIMRAYEHTKRPLSQRERDRYLAEQAVIGRMGGAEWVPTTVAELDDYVDTMRSRLSVNAQTREFIDFLMTSPFFPNLPGPVDRQLHRFAIYAGHEPRPAVGARTHRIRPSPGIDPRTDRSGTAGGRAQVALGVRHTALRPTRARTRGERSADRRRPAVIDGQLIEVVGGATVGGRVDESADRTSKRILDAALQEAAAVGLQRITVEEVVRRAGVSRMTAYRRYPRRDDLVEALVRRETQRFLAAVADAIDAVDDPHEGVAEAFIAAVRFARDHPMLRRAGQLEPAPIADSVELLTMGSAFIANYIHGEAPGTPSQQVRWVADVFARLFLTYISMPPADPNFGDDAELRRFAHEVLTPMVERASASGA